MVARAGSRPGCRRAGPVRPVQPPLQRPGRPQTGGSCTGRARSCAAWRPTLTPSAGSSQRWPAVWLTRVPGPGLGRRPGHPVPQLPGASPPTTRSPTCCAGCSKSRFATRPVATWVRATARAIRRVLGLTSCAAARPPLAAPGVPASPGGVAGGEGTCVVRSRPVRRRRRRPPLAQLVGRALAEAPARTWGPRVSRPTSRGAQDPTPPPGVAGGPRYVRRMVRTVGLEEELMLPRPAQPGGGAGRPARPEEFRSVAVDGVTPGSRQAATGRGSTGLFRHQLEIRTDPACDADDLHAAGRGPPDRGEAAAAAGSPLGACGTVPPSAVRRRPSRRTTGYRDMVDTFGDVARTGGTCGMRTSTSASSPTRRGRRPHRIAPWLPALLALERRELAVRRGSHLATPRGGHGVAPVAQPVPTERFGLGRRLPRGVPDHALASGAAATRDALPRRPAVDRAKPTVEVQGQRRHPDQPGRGGRSRSRVRAGRDGGARRGVRRPGANLAGRGAARGALAGVRATAWPTTWCTLPTASCVRPARCSTTWPATSARCWPGRRRGTGGGGAGARGPRQRGDPAAGGLRAHRINSGRRRRPWSLARKPRGAPQPKVGPRAKRSRLRSSPALIARGTGRRCGATWTMFARMLREGVVRPPTAR